MEVTTQEFRRCSVVKASGRIDAATAPQLQHALDALTEAGKYRLVLDMSEVDFMSSVGLRVLIDTRKTCRRYNRGDLVLAGPSANVVRTLELAGFYSLFDVYDTPIEAVGNI
ncbi:MAG: STAS domain-containing protein [Chloroflexota bacterium]|nr:STAS domain-containing protein [Chloroflexota bacterium]